MSSPSCLITCPIHIAALALLAARAPAQATTVRISVATSGTPANGACDRPDVSADGRYVVFDSLATNLTTGDTNGTYDVFLRDVELGTTTLVSHNMAGVPSNEGGGVPKISGDGRTVFFTSRGDDFVTGDTNTFNDGFAYDVATGAITRVTMSHTGGQLVGATYVDSCSYDGRLVAFTSSAFNCVPNDFNNAYDVFVRDLQTGVIQRASVSTAGVEGSESSGLAALSGDGLHVSFTSMSPFAANDVNGSQDAYVHDLATGMTELVSVGFNGAASGCYISTTAISRDGRYVAFISDGVDLVLGDNNAFGDVFVRDRASQTTRRCSLGLGGADPDDVPYSVAISPNGQLVAFESAATNLVPGDTNGKRDVFLYDWVGNVTRRTSVSLIGSQALNESNRPAIGAGGNVVVFRSVAYNLVHTPSVGPHIYMRRDAPPVPQAFCTAGTTTHGCAASMSASAQPSLSLATPCTIQVSDVEGGRLGAFFYGIDNAAFGPLAWGMSSSYLCVKPPTQRSAPQNSGGATNTCSGALTLDWNAFQNANPSGLGQPWLAGRTAYIQAWFRDPPSPKHTMLSNALELVYVP